MEARNGSADGLTANFNQSVVSLCNRQEEKLAEMNDQISGFIRKKGSKQFTTYTSNQLSPNDFGDTQAFFTGKQQLTEFQKLLSPQDLPWKGRNPIQINHAISKLQQPKRVFSSITPEIEVSTFKQRNKSLAMTAKNFTKIMNDKMPRVKAEMARRGTLMNESMNNTTNSFLDGKGTSSFAQRVQGDISPFKSRSRSIFNKKTSTLANPLTRQQIKESLLHFKQTSEIQMKDQNTKISKCFLKKTAREKVNEAPKADSVDTSSPDFKALPPLAKTQVITPSQDKFKPFTRNNDQNSKDSFKQALELTSKLKNTPITQKMKSNRNNSIQKLEFKSHETSKQRLSSFYKQLYGANIADISYDQFKLVDKVKEFEAKYLEQQKHKLRMNLLPTTLESEFQPPLTPSKPLTTSWTLQDQVKIYYPETLQQRRYQLPIEKESSPSVKKISHIRFEPQGTGRYLDFEPVVKAEIVDEDQELKDYEIKQIDQNYMKTPNHNDAENVFEDDLEKAQEYSLPTVGRKEISAEVRKKMVEHLRVVDQIIKGRTKPIIYNLEDELNSDIFGSENLNDSDDHDIEDGYIKNKLIQNKKQLQRISVPFAKFVPSIKLLTEIQQERKKKFKQLKNLNKSLNAQVAALTMKKLLWKHTDHEYPNSQVLRNLIQSDRSFKKEIDSLNPKTRQLLSNLLRDNQMKVDRLKKIALAQSKIKSQKMEIENLKREIRLAQMKEIESGDMLESIGNFAIRTTESGFDCGFSPGRRKQVPSNLTDAKQLQIEVETTEKVSMAKWVNLIRNKILPKLNHKLEVRVISGVAKFQKAIVELLEVDQAESVGWKYHFLSFNIWKNLPIQELLISKEKEFKHNKIPYDRASHFKTVFLQEVTPEAAETLGTLINEYGAKLEFFGQMKGRPIEFREPIAGDKPVIRSQVLLDHQACNKDIARQSFFKNCERNYRIAVPSFAKIIDNCLFLNEYTISDDQAETLKDFLIKANDLTQYHLKKLIIESSGMQDHQLACILQGIGEQLEFSQIQSISYNGGQFGEKSQEQLVRLIPWLKELEICNIQKQGSPEQMRLLLQAILNNSMVINKLKISKLFLGDDQAFKSICNIIRAKSMLWSLNLSWAKLSAKQLKLLAQTLIEIPDQLRMLDLSYNALSLDESQSDFKASTEFLSLFSEYLQKTHTLSHLNLSGMNILYKPLKSLCDTLSKSFSLQAIHLNNNLVMQNLKRADKLLLKFGIDQKFNPDSNQFEISKQEFTVNKPTSQPQHLIEAVRSVFRQIKSSEVLDHNCPIDAETYKNHYVLANQAKHLKQVRQQLGLTANDGIGQMHVNNIDCFALTRLVNHPELVFNQDQNSDSYFNVNSSSNWKLSLKNECFECHKHKYVAICYDQSTQANANASLKEIKDKQLVLKVKEALNLDILHRDNTTPFICGTVVNGGFSRKLKMLRLDFYALMVLSNSKDVIGNKKVQTGIKKGIVAMARSNQEIPFENFKHYLGMYQKVLQDFWFKNQLIDVQLLNEPKEIKDWRMTIPMDHDCHRFVFAAYLPPGIHQFLIFCPKTNRVFAKEFVVNATRMSFQYPEVPLRLDQSDNKQKIIFKDIWAKYKFDTPHFLTQCHSQDTINSQFDASLFIKSPEDAAACLRLMRDHYQMINVAFRHLQTHSLNEQSFPQISLRAFFQFVESVNETMDEADRVPKEIFELQFIRATRFDNAGKMKGALSRGEFSNLMIRVCASMTYDKDQDYQVSEYLGAFVNKFLEKTFKVSPMHLKNYIVSDKKVNKLLFINQQGLFQIMNDFKENPSEFSSNRKPKFTITSARNMGQVILKKDEPFQKLIDSAFIFCQQTVLNEHRYIDSYLQLSKLEFQEFVVRSAIAYFDNMLSKIETGGSCEFQDWEIKRMELSTKLMHILQILWENKHKQKSKGAPIEELKVLDEDEYSDDEVQEIN